MSRTTRCIFVALVALLLAPLAALYGAAPALHTFPTIHADAIGQKLQSAMIWADPSQDKPGVTIAFRKTFDLPVKPTQAALHLFADVRYVLWVNGTYVERGPNRFQPNGPEYDTINLVPHLQAGRNAVAVLVVGNLSGGKVMRHAPGLTAQLDVEGQRTLSHRRQLEMERRHAIPPSQRVLAQSRRVAGGCAGRGRRLDASRLSGWPLETGRVR